MINYIKRVRAEEKEMQSNFPATFNRLVKFAVITQIYALVIGLLVGFILFHPGVPNWLLGLFGFILWG